MAKTPMFLRSSDVLEQLAAQEERITKQGEKITILERRRDSDAALQSQALVAAIEKVGTLITAAILKEALDAATLAKFAKAIDANTVGVIEAQQPKPAVDPAPGGERKQGLSNED